MKKWYALFSQVYRTVGVQRKIRIAPERKKNGLTDVLQEAYKPIKSLTIEEALRSSYFWDIRVLVVFSAIIWFNLVMFWSIEPVGLQCTQEGCPFKEIGIPRCPFWDKERAIFFQRFFYEGIEFSKLYDWIHTIARAEEPQERLGFDPLQVQSQNTEEASARMIHTATMPAAIVLGIMVLTLKLVESTG